MNARRFVVAIGALVLFVALIVPLLTAVIVMLVNLVS